MLTVLFATRNGEASLDRTLEAMARLREPVGGWKLVAVDNGSEDRTPQILEAWRGRLALTVVHEEKPGKNNALNRGLEHIEGDLVVLTDDDVLPAEDWLVQYRALAESRTGASIFGGPIQPAWEVQPPPELLERLPLGPLFAVSDSRLEEGAAEPRAIWGANMAVRARVFDEGLRFDPGIGPSANPNYAMGSETEFTVRAAQQAGYGCYFSPKVVVRHIVPKKHLARGWIRARARRFGRSQARIGAGGHAATEAAPSLFGIPRWGLRRLVELRLRRYAMSLCGRRGDALAADWAEHELRGKLETRRRAQ